LWFTSFLLNIITRLILGSSSALRCTLIFCLYFIIRFFWQNIFELFLFRQFWPCLLCKLTSLLRIKMFPLLCLFFLNKLFFKNIEISFWLISLIFWFSIRLRTFIVLWFWETFFWLSIFFLVNFSFSLFRFVLAFRFNFCTSISWFFLAFFWSTFRFWFFISFGIFFLLSSWFFTFYWKSRLLYHFLR